MGESAKNVNGRSGRLCRTCGLVRAEAGDRGCGRVLEVTPYSCRELEVGAGKCGAKSDDTARGSNSLVAIWQSLVANASISAGEWLQIATQLGGI
jgi:hypothetical protein